MAKDSINLSPALYHYLINHSVRDTPVLKQLREVTNQMNGAVMQISPDQGQFMGLLVKLLGAKSILEVGTFTGYSALVMAQSLPETGRLITCDINIQATNIAKDFWQQAGVADKIELKLDRALNSVKGLLETGGENQFDLMFLDADKDNYDAYYELGLKLVRPGGLILIDNVLWDGKVLDESVQDKQTQSIRALNAKLVKDPRIDLSMVPIGDGLSLCRVC